MYAEKELSCKKILQQADIKAKFKKNCGCLGTGPDILGCLGLVLRKSRGFFCRNRRKRGKRRKRRRGVARGGERKAEGGEGGSPVQRGV